MKRLLTHAGWDTEYDQERSVERLPDGREGYSFTGRQAPVTTQLYLHNVFLTDGDTFNLIVAFGDKLLYFKEFKTGTSFVFDDRGLKAGMEYYEAFKSRLLKLIEILNLSIDKKSGFTLWTHYSNAELANIIPTRKELKELIELNDDYLHASKEGSKWNSDNLRIFPKGKSFNIQNIKLAEGIKAHVYDTTHLFAKVSLEKLGETIGIEKIEHPNWDEVSASEWLASDKEKFVDYAATDAIIPCIAATQFYKCIRDLIKDLSNEGVIPPLEHKEVKKALNRRYMTASNCSETIATLYLIQNGVREDFKKLNSRLIELIVRPALTKVKGGLNKFYVSDKPEHFINVDSWDLKSAYLTALTIIKLPLWEPVSVGYKKSTFHKLSQRLDQLEGCYYQVKYSLPVGCSEWDRINIFVNDRYNQGFTGRITGDNQWLTHWEIQAQAKVTPHVEIEIINGIHWEKQIGGKYANMLELMNPLSELRSNYKASNNDAMQNTIKLIGNGTYGKIAQQTNALIPEMIHDSIMQDGLITASTHCQVIHSKISNPIYANWITGFIRACVAITARENKAIMAVTDSLLVNGGSFTHSKDIKVPYGHLRKALESCTWQLEHNNVNAMIFKERDYYLYKVSPLEAQSIIKEIESGIMSNESIENMDIVKAAKRGVKLQNDNNNKLFVKLCNGRKNGNPLEFIDKTLGSAKEMLLYDKILNRPSESTKKLGSANLRYNCDTHEEFIERNKLNELCRRKGFADSVHCKMESPEEFERLKKKIKSGVRHKSKVDHEMRYLIMVTLDDKLISLRELEKITDIGKSTLQRWHRDFKKSCRATRKQILKCVREQNIEDPLETIAKYFSDRQLSHPGLGGAFPQEGRGTFEAESLSA